MWWPRPRRGWAPSQRAIDGSCGLAPLLRRLVSTHTLTVPKSCFQISRAQGDCGADAALLFPLRHQLQRAGADPKPTDSEEEAMKFRPLHDRVVVRRVEEDTKTAGGIIIPDTAKEKPMQGEVI